MCGPARTWANLARFLEKAGRLKSRIDAILRMIGRRHVHAKRPKTVAHALPKTPLAAGFS
jgi:hypothetical protein